MDIYNHQSKITPYLFNSPLFESNDFNLLDIGASGGIDPLWRQFEPYLSAKCFDPLCIEVERLNKAEKNGKIEYIDSWVSCKDQQILDGAQGCGHTTNSSFQKSSAVRAANAMQINYEKHYFNSDQEVIYSKNRTSIDEYIKSSNFPADFIKVDTDGHDYFVINGAQEAFKNHLILGVQIECQFHGSTHPHSNIFSNIDLYMRKMGYTLFDLNCWRYTREDLPGEFYYTIPAQTKRGQIQWGEAVYFLDPFTNIESRNELFKEGNQHKLIKLISLYDLYSQSDSSAGLINLMKEKNITISNVNLDKALDLLTPINKWGINNYQQYIDKFDSDPELFYPKK